MSVHRVAYSLSMPVRPHLLRRHGGVLDCRYSGGDGEMVIRTLLWTILFLSLAGCSAGGSSSQGRSAPVLLAEARARCPAQVVYKTLPRGCQYTRSWNGATSVFKTPHRLWGVAYAFNCGSRPGGFSFDARMPGMDHMALPGPEQHAKRGSGYVMFSRSKMLNMLSGVPPEYKMDGNLMVIDLATTCTWHVKAILGSQHHVQSAVPPVPKMEAAWWK